MGTLRVLAGWPAPTVDVDTRRGSRARSCTSCGRASRRLRRTSPCPRSTTAPSTPPRCGSACCTTPGGPGCRTAEVDGAAAHAGGRAALDGRGRRRRRRRLPGVPRRQRARPGQPGLEGLRATRSGSPTAASPTVRSRSARCRRTRTRRRSHGADLLDAFGRPGAERYRELGRRAGRAVPGGVLVRRRPPDRFPALALDGAKRPVDSLTSNIGHLLGTGLLDPEEELRRRPAPGRARPRLRARPAHHVRARRRLRPAQLPLRLGLAARHRDRDPRAAPGRARRATPTVWSRACCGRRWPSTSGCPSCGPARVEPVPYPAACRPQAWSAAAAVVVADGAGRLRR